MFGFVLRLLTGAGGITESLSKAYRARLDAQSDKDKLTADLTVRAIEAEIEARRGAREIRMATAGFWEMRLAVGLIGVSTSVHYAAIILDSVYQFEWNVAALPSPFDQYEGHIILSFFGLQAVTGIGSALIARFKK